MSTCRRLIAGEVYSGKVFIDASYEGDLMAAAGVSYTIGREANAQYGNRIIRIVDGVIEHDKVREEAAVE